MHTERAEVLWCLPVCGSADGGSGRAGARGGGASEPKQTTRNNNTSSTKQNKTKQKEGRRQEEPTLYRLHTPLQPPSSAL